MSYRATTRSRAATIGLAAIGVLMGVLTPLSPAHAADTVTLTFESGPALGTAVNDEYLASHFVRFVASDPGFRPYRRSAPAQARSGTIVADVGSDVCFTESGNAGGCEFVDPSMTGQLVRTASAVTLYAGLFTPPSGTVTARLTAFRANGSVIASGPPAVISAAGFTTPVSVTSVNADIAKFVLSVEGGIGATLGFDDLTLSFPDDSLPEIAVSAPKTVATLLQRSTLDVPITVTRLNGSSGAVDMTVAGLPPGVSGTFLTDPLPGTAGATVLRLSAINDAEPFLQPATVTVSADPLGNASVAPGPRQDTFPLTVGSSFDLSVSGGPRVALPTCSATDLTISLRRNITFAGTVTLSAFVNGASAQILPSPEVPPGGNLIAERTLRLTRTGFLTPGTRVTVTATAAGAPSRTVQFDLANASATASLTSGLGLTPRRGQPGTLVRIEGNGFCPGTQVEVGNRHAKVPADVSADARSLTFRVPRLATSGPVTVIPQTNAPFVTGNSLQVRSFRNREGFAFDNYPFEWLSFGELTDLVGIGDMFLEVNACWPFANCPIPTGVPDPVAYIAWGIINGALRSSGGHCFGINRTVQELLAGKTPYLTFASGADVPFDLPSAAGPNSALSSHLDSRHAGQTTTEFLYKYLTRDRSLTAQLATLRSELAAGRDPGVSLRRGATEGHVVTAYDVEDQPDGSVRVYVYDNNLPFVAAESTDADLHKFHEDLSVITVAAVRRSWSFFRGGGSVWTGNSDQWFTIPLSAVPDDPSLPGVNALTSLVIFGSSGAADVTEVPAGAEYMPLLGDGRDSDSGVVARLGSGDLKHSVTGSATGTYSEAALGEGFVAAVTDVKTRAGVSDVVDSDPGNGSISFNSGMTRALTVELGLRKGSVHRSATVSTASAKGGREVLELGRALTYRHRGSSTRWSFELTSATRRGVQRFTSGPLRLPVDGAVRVRPESWTSLDSVRLVTRAGQGKTSVRILRDKTRPAVRVRLSKPSLKRVAGKVVVTSRMTVRGKAPLASAGAVLRIYSGDRVLVRKAKAVLDPRRVQRLRWRLPGLSKSVTRLRVDGRLVLSGSDSVTDRAIRVL